MKKDASVELLRIFACFVVVGTHIKLVNYINADETINKSVILISNFFGEGVTFFFLILGFFYFNNKDFIKMCVRTIKNILVPASIFLLFVATISSWIDNTKSLIECFLFPHIEIKNIIEGIVSQDSSIFEHGQHLWFCFTYIQCIMWFPILYCVNTYSRKVLPYVTILGIIAMIIIDIQKTTGFGIQIATFSIVPIPVIILLVGHYIYSQRMLFWNKKIWLIIGFLIYVSTHIVLFYIQCDALARKTGQGFAWNSIYYLISASGLTIAFLSISVKKDKLSKFIRYVGGKTFYIYLLHYPIIIRLNNIRVRELFLEKSRAISMGALGEIIYTISYTAFVFTMSFAIVASIDLVNSGIKMLINITKNKHSDKFSRG